MITDAKAVGNRADYDMSLCAPAARRRYRQWSSANHVAPFSPEPLSRIGVRRRGYIPRAVWNYPRADPQHGAHTSGEQDGCQNYAVAEDGYDGGNRCRGGA